ncbi:MAG: response regulator transcription factor [Gammaproteobacteria bacterium]|nr:response regulator transcription factor [Gammaproteobacteria bacterium]MDE2345676.1 response regulator transcription factor [Gammaproteobacteria bacterium]
MYLEILHHGAVVHASLRHCVNFRNILVRFEMFYVSLGFDADYCNLNKFVRRQKTLIALKCPNSELSQWGSRLLAEAGYAVSIIDAPDAVARNNAVEHIRLVVMLQSVLNDEAIEWCRNYCAVNTGVPLLVISKRRDSEFELNILKTGADRYLSYPLIPELLAAHIETLTRRSVALKQTSTAVLLADPVSRRVKIGNSELQLAPVLFRLLDEFLSHPGEVLTLEVLLATIETQRKPLQRNVVKAYVHQLRKVLNSCGYPDVIKTLHRVGYRYDPPAIH